MSGQTAGFYTRQLSGRRKPWRENGPEGRDLVRGDGAGFGPFADCGDFFGAGHTERLGGGEFRQEDFSRERLFGGESGVKGGSDGLFDFGAGKAFAGGREFMKIETVRVTVALFQVQSEEMASSRGRRKVHEEDFVEAAFAEHFGRKS